MRALVGYKALADLYGCPFYLRWENNTHCPADFEELFVPDGIQLIPRDRIPVEREAGAIIGKDADWFTRIGERHGYGGATRDHFLRQSLVNLRALSPRPDLARAIADFADAHLLSERTGVHIRYTDNLATQRDWVGKIEGFRPELVSRLEGFEKYIAGEIDARPDARLFLATDNPSVERRFRKRFGRHIITYPKTYRGILSRWLARLRYGRTVRTTPMSIAVIEFYLLARCRKLVGTYFSSFAELACVINGVDYHSVIGVEVRERPINRKFRHLFDDEPVASEGVDVRGSEVY